MKQLGEILVDDGLLTPDQLVKASEERDRLGRSLGRVLVDLGMVTEAQLVGALAAQIQNSGHGEVFHAGRGWSLML